MTEEMLMYECEETEDQDGVVYAADLPVLEKAWLTVLNTIVFVPMYEFANAMGRGSEALYTWFSRSLTFCGVDKLYDIVEE